jgi:hypothetical protein
MRRMQSDERPALVVIGFGGVVAITALGHSLFRHGTGPMIGSPADVAGLLVYLMVIGVAVIVLSRRQS